MVENFHIENFTRFYKAQRDIYILHAGRRVAAGMVVDKYNTGSAVGYGAAEYFPRMNDGSIKTADGYVGKGNDLIFRVQK